MRKCLIAWLAIIALLTMPSAVAKKLYKYQDESGKWHFSDIPPKTTQRVDTDQLSISERPQKVTVRQRGSRTEPVLYIVNEYHGPVTVEIQLLKSKNIVTQPTLPARFVIPPLGEMRAVEIRPATPGRAWSYQYQYHVTLGDPEVQHRPPKPYRPPFETGLTFPISQAFHGAFSHKEPFSEYAVDIVMPEGTHVCTARAGVIMDVANDFMDGGLDAKYHSRANAIRILHDDGTMAVYAHLKLESALVAPGSRVTEGQCIAESGNTGFSGGPHLHFVIQKNEDMDLISLPFRFEAENGQAVTPARGMLLTAQ